MGLGDAYWQVSETVGFIGVDLLVGLGREVDSVSAVDLVCDGPDLVSQGHLVGVEDGKVARLLTCLGDRCRQVCGAGTPVGEVG